MIIHGFKDELVKLGPGPLTKTARVLRSGSDPLLQRMAATGALAGAGLHGAQSAKSVVTGDRGPDGTLLGAAGRTALGGLLAGAGLKALGRMSRRR